MILGSSKDPVLIKKIYLKIWTLRDEVEAVIKARIESGEPDNISVDDLIEEYKLKAKNREESVSLEVINGGKDDSSQEEKSEEADGDNEEASAEAESESESEESGETQGDEPEKSDEESQEETENQTDHTSSPVEVIQRRPNIPEERIFNGTTVLTELNMEEMYFFSNQSFLEGQSIVIEFLVPKKFIVNANVFYSRPYNHKSRIIRDNNLIYRVAVKFSFLKPGERTLLRQFVKSVEPDLEKAAKPKEAPKPKSEGFDDLDELDL